MHAEPSRQDSLRTRFHELNVSFTGLADLVHQEAGDKENDLESHEI